MKYVFIFLVLTMFSCKEEMVCDNQKLLFQYGNAKTIKIDLNNNYVKVKELIKYQYKEDFCSSPEFNFSFNYKEEQILLPFKVFYCPEIRLHPNMITFLFSDTGDFLIESEIVKKEDIALFIKKNILIERERRKTEVFYLSLQMNNKINDLVFNTILENTLDGIYLYYEEVSIKKFKKEICQLTKVELNELTSEFKFAFTHYKPIPPPETQEFF